jgi:phage-related protein
MAQVAKESGLGRESLYEAPALGAKARVDHLHGAVWEVRTSLRNRIARTLFAVDGSTTTLLHGFIKKTQKTPASEITFAERRFQEWKHDEYS